MNILKTYVSTTPRSDTFLVYWTNTAMAPKGILRIRVTATIEDRGIVAELVAIQHLLEKKHVIGTNLSGNDGIKLIVSSGAIRKLHLRKSDKVHLVPYANFLTTRFAGCQLSVEKNIGWFDGFSPELIEDHLVSGARRETIQITGIGDVSVTQHVLDRFADRFLAETPSGKTAQTAWKKLVELAAEPSVCEVTRHSLWSGVNHMHQGRQEGRYFMNAKCRLVLVVTDNPREGKRLVTTYPTNHHFHIMQQAA